MINTCIMNNIEEINFKTILHIWKNELWPGRISPIETHSAMLYLHNHDMNNFSLPNWYHGCYIDNKLIGVNSGHLCVNNNVRSRGLWVCPEYRKKGYGKQLLLATVDKAKTLNASFVWSYPRKSSWVTYKSVGFKLTTEWQKSETSDANCYCILDL
jgi:GNAT superfamily N-acetyltransferase